MQKIFIAYCAFVVATLAYANYTGHVATNLFSSQKHADKFANQYHK